MGKRYISPVPIPFLLLPLLPHAHADGLYNCQLSLPLVFVRALERSSCSPKSYEDFVIIMFIGMYVDYIHYTVLCYCGVHNISQHSAASTDKLRPRLPLQSQFMKTQIRQPMSQSKFMTTQIRQPMSQSKFMTTQIRQPMSQSKFMNTQIRQPYVTWM